MIPTCAMETRPRFGPRLQMIAASCACAAASAYVFAVNPAQGLYPQCLLYRTTGFYCAGCGATRALHALLHGRFMEALHDNVLFVTLLPVAVTVAGLYAWNAWKQDAWPAVMVGESRIVRTGLGLITLMLIFTAVRNLPGAPFDLLRPLPAG
jgi:hypothetical protein